MIDEQSEIAAAYHSLPCGINALWVISISLGGSPMITDKLLTR